MAHNTAKHEPTTQKPSRTKKPLRKAENASDENESISTKDLKEFHMKIRESWKAIQNNRFKVIPTSKGPYKSDRWIWQGVILFCFLWLLFIAHNANYNLDYFQCGTGERLYEGAHQVCKNPFYNQENDWKCQEILPYGKYGTEPGPLFKNAGKVSFLIMIFGALLNHVWHNKRFGR